MSGTKKSQRKPHDFRATSELKKLRKEITEIAMRDFGYDHDRCEKQIEKFAQCVVCEDKEAVVAKMRERNERFYAAFVADERNAVLQLFRDIAREYEHGNSIHPSGEAVIEEYKERREHLNNAVGLLYTLIQEMEYIAETLPCDKNKYDDLADRLETEIKLIKGVRRAANKYLKVASKDDTEGNL